MCEGHSLSQACLSSVSLLPACSSAFPLSFLSPPSSSISHLSPLFLTLCPLPYPFKKIDLRQNLFIFYRSKAFGDCNFQSVEGEGPVLVCCRQSSMCRGLCVRRAPCAEGSVCRGLMPVIWSCPWTMEGAGHGPGGAGQSVGRGWGLPWDLLSSFCVLFCLSCFENIGGKNKRERTKNNVTAPTWNCHFCFRYFKYKQMGALTQTGWASFHSSACLLLPHPAPPGGSSTVSLMCIFIICFHILTAYM